jgi:hypothetical protein
MAWLSRSTPFEWKTVLSKSSPNLEGGSTPRISGALDFHPGTLEALKWLAVLLMTLDHINLQLLQFAHPWMYKAGRLALPLFVFVLAYNLARAPAGDAATALRVLTRLLPFAAVSCLPYWELNFARFGLLPLNVLFTLAAGAAIVALLERPTQGREAAAVVLFVGAGGVVDFGWTGIALFVACWQCFRNPSVFWAFAAIALLTLLFGTNGNFWALAALPVIALASTCRLPVKRIKGALYYFYPVHLCVLVVLQITIFDR